MEEKKLTDEEIAKAILQSIEYSKTITYFDEWGNCKAIMMSDVIDLIHRLQSENAGLKKRGEIVINSLHETIDKQKAEIERLKIQKDKALIIKDELQEKCISLNFENKELQKQVDELKKRNYWLESEHEHQCEKSYFEGVEKGQQQAVKDTAKEILNKANELWLDTINPNCLIGKIENWIKERYGVEVE